MAYEHYPSPQSVVAALLELTRYLVGLARLEGRGIQKEATAR